MNISMDGYKGVGLAILLVVVLILGATVLLKGGEGSQTHSVTVQPKQGASQESSDPYQSSRNKDRDFGEAPKFELPSGLVPSKGR